MRKRRCIGRIFGLPQMMESGRFGRARSGLDKYRPAPGIGITACLAIHLADGAYLAIRVHRFGWLKDCGRILLEAYRDRERVFELFREGDLVQIGQDIEPKTGEHSLAAPENGVCVYVHRDCRIMEEKPEAVRFTGLEEMRKKYPAYYCYIYENGENGGWTLSRHGKTMPLDEAVREEKERMF